MRSLSSHDADEPLDYDNLSIITRPRPPRRRQSGVSLIPFRPYVRSLSSVRQPFSFTDGYQPWQVTGHNEIFFRQPNARCIGSLIDDCDESDVIRWDIEGESTRLPMMCKLWMIVDGAVVERGKPHLVQDAAVQVFTAGRNLRATLAAEQRANYHRRRRQSWHDLNEYHSVPYHQYTRSIRLGSHELIQCDLDQQPSTIDEPMLLDLDDQTIEEEYSINITGPELLRETIHRSWTPPDRVLHSIPTPTRLRTMDRSTSIDQGFIRMFNLHLETNEILLSTIVNPYRLALPSDEPFQRRFIDRRGIERRHQSVSTGDDYPRWWLRLSTDQLLSSEIFDRSDETNSKEKRTPSPFPSPRLERSVQTDPPRSRSLSPPLRLPTIQRSSSRTTITNRFEIVDEIDLGNREVRYSTRSDISQTVDLHPRIECRSHESSLDHRMARDDDKTIRLVTSTKSSDSDYKTFVSSLHEQNHLSYSTPDQSTSRSVRPCAADESNRERRKSPSTSSLTHLRERYERTLRERQGTRTVVNHHGLGDIAADSAIRGREQIQNPSAPAAPSSARSPRFMELQHDVSIFSNGSRDDQSISTTVRLTTDKYRSMPVITSEEMIQGHIPSPGLCLTKSIVTSSRERPPPMVAPPQRLIHRTDYADKESPTGSAWIRYNEHRIEQLQKRIDLMLQIDDDDEQIVPTTATVTQRIDDILMNNSLHPRSLLCHHHRSLVPSARRWNQSLPTTPRMTSRNTSRSTTPVSKSVRISPHVSSHSSPLRPSTEFTRPIHSILRRRSVPPNVARFTLPVQPRPAASRGTRDVPLRTLEQLPIPRYYRLYNDVSFRELYHFSRLLDTYLDPNRTSGHNYSSVIRDFALDQQLPSTVTSAA